MPGPRRTGFGIDGYTAWRAAVRGFRDAARRERTWYTVTVVHYGPYHEFGTRRGLRARPHWRVATVRLSAGAPVEKAIPGVHRRRTGQRTIRGASDAQREWELWFAPEGQAGGAVARALRDEVKAVIREKGIWKTGNYHESIAHGRSLPEAAERSRAQLLDPSTAVQAA